MITYLRMGVGKEVKNKNSFVHDSREQVKDVAGMLLISIATELTTLPLPNDC